MDFASSIRAAENRTMLKGNVANLSMLLQLLFKQGYGKNRKGLAKILNI